MRVLLIPEVYRPDDATACGTVNDAATWVHQWLERDEHVHVYWLLPPRESAGYDAGYVHADRERVTLIEAPSVANRLDGGGDPGTGDGPDGSDGDDGPDGDGGPAASMLTEDGYTAAELSAVRGAIFEPGGYLDAVVDQRRFGRPTLAKWLLSHVDQWAASVRPFDVIANVHDLQVPEKYRYCAHRNDFQGRMAMAGAVLADGIWFSAGVDARRLREHATDVLAPPVVEGAMEEAVEVGSPIDFDAFEETYADEPGRLHVAGSFWAKKNADVVFDVARRLHDRSGVRTVLTSMEPIPAEFREPDWVEAHGEADRGTYRRALRRGDLAVCASQYETMARTPFEQAASGQVLLLRDEPWIYDCVPDDHPLVSGLGDLPDLAVAAVERWDDAVAANRRLVEHARSVRSPAVVGQRTHGDLERRVREKRRRFESAADGVGGADGVDRPTGGPAVSIDAVERALADLGDAPRLDRVVDVASRHAGADAPAADDGTLPLAEVVYALRALGYRDRGNPGTPVFERAAAPSAADRLRRRTPE